MIVGLGLDIAAISRVERALERHGARFSDRVLTPEERADLGSRSADAAQFVAGRFAAKEAATKALGGPSDVFWQDIRIRRESSGAPRLELVGAAVAHAARLGVTRTWIAISHDAGVATAVVILESDSAR
jgi:holo-[acyl-carrier protein] synthase